MTPQKACRFVLGFGKHKGKTLGQIYVEDRQYITEFLQRIDWKDRPEWQRRATQSHVASLLAHVRRGTLTFDGDEPSSHVNGSGNPAHADVVIKTEALGALAFSLALLHRGEPIKSPPQEYKKLGFTEVPHKSEREEKVLLSVEGKSVIAWQDAGENLRRAIAYYESALRVYTEADFPLAWARTQINLGNAYSDLPTGDRGENLRRAIACYESAQRVYTEADFPSDWASTQFGLGLALRKEGRLNESVRSFDCAARGYANVGYESNSELARTQAEKSRLAKDPSTET